jgi:S-DNA-T family DNA segregation ATPase FtsK/SpoIIIE
MLYMAGGGRITRVHGPFVSDKEVELIVNHLKEQGSPTYIEDVTRDPEEGMALGEGAEGEEGEEGEIYRQAVAIVLRDRKASTSYLQRMLKLGYNRAARLVDRMEAEGIVGPANHVGKREVIG